MVLVSHRLTRDSAAHGPPRREFFSSLTPHDIGLENRKVDKPLSGNENPESGAIRHFVADQRLIHKLFSIFQFGRCGWLCCKFSGECCGCCGGLKVPGAFHVRAGATSRQVSRAYRARNFERSRARPNNTDSWRGGPRVLSPLAAGAKRRGGRRFITLALAVAVSLSTFSTIANARHRWGCARAAALGGPCGCSAMAIVGLTNTRYWLVRNWRDFPRTSPHVGAAAIWRNHSHVEIVSRVNGDGTVDTRGSVGWHHVPASRLVFVQPGGKRGHS
jgi:hypothetical protein